MKKFLIVAVAGIILGVIFVWDADASFDHRTFGAVIDLKILQRKQNCILENQVNQQAYGNCLMLCKVKQDVELKTKLFVSPCKCVKPKIKKCY